MDKDYRLGDFIIKKLDETLKVNPDEFAALKAALERDTFKVLVATILSQNTTERNTFKALERLEKIGIKPERLATLTKDELEKIIAPAGLQSQKAEAILQVAKLVRDKYGGDLSRLLKEDEQRIREELHSVRGIGEKTIDVLLANHGFPVIPIDTHVRRVAQRLGLTDSTKYEDIRGDLHRVFRPEVRLQAHLLLIKLGREICKARKPACEKCPLKSVCKYYKAYNKQ